MGIHFGRIARRPSAGLWVHGPKWFPLDIDVTRNARSVDRYHMHIVNDPSLSPFLLQMAVFSAIDATERAGGCFQRARQRIDFIREPQRPRPAQEQSLRPTGVPPCKLPFRPRFRWLI